MKIKLPTKDQLKVWGSYALVALSLSPPVFAAVGAIYAPAAAFGLAIQEMLHVFGIQPGAVQGALGGTGAILLRKSEPKPS